MKVKDVMTKDIISVDKNVNLRYVLKLMKKNEITKIPVVEDKKLVGVITDNIIAMKLGSIKTKGVPASRLHASFVTEKEIDTISPEEELETVLKKVGKPGPTIINVIDNNNLVGILTKADLLPLVNSNKKISEIMNKKLNVADPSDRVVHARNTMKQEDVARLLVMDKGKLVGIISDNEIAFALASVKRAFPMGKQKHQLDELLIKDVMKTKVVWARPSITISDAAKIMMKFNVGSLPLIEGDIVKGIVTRTNLLKTVKS